MSTRYRLYDARGYDFPVDDHFDPFWTKLSLKSEFFGNFEPRDLPPLAASTTPLAKLAAAQRVRGLSLLSVADVVQAPDAPAPPGGLRLAYSGSDARVYSNPSALPRAFLVGQQWVVPKGSRALDAVYSTRFDPRTVAVTERPLAGLPAGGPAAPAATSGDAKLERYDAERVTITATAARPSLLVLTDSFFPGWKATVDGKSVPIQRVDYLLRGVQLAQGTHRIKFRYQPASWRAGWIISLIAVAGLAFSVAGGWRRLTRRRRRIPPAGAV